MNFREVSRVNVVESIPGDFTVPIGVEWFVAKVRVFHHQADHIYPEAIHPFVEPKAHRIQ